VPRGGGMEKALAGTLGRGGRREILDFIRGFHGFSRIIINFFILIRDNLR